MAGPSKTRQSFLYYFAHLLRTLYAQYMQIGRKGEGVIRNIMFKGKKVIGNVKKFFLKAPGLLIEPSTLPFCDYF